MSEDTVELIKALAVVFLLMALAVLALSYVALLARTHGGGLPIVDDLLPPYEPPAAIPALVDMRFLVQLGAGFLSASGLALFAWSRTLDTALTVLAKSVTVILSAGLGMFAGTWAFMKLSADTELSLLSLNRPAIALVLFFAFATALRNASLRGLGPLRFVAATALVLLGPVVQATL